MPTLKISKTKRYPYTRKGMRKAQQAKKHYRKLGYTVKTKKR